MIWRGIRFCLYFGEREKQNWTRLGGGGLFYATLGPVLSSMYKIKNGDNLGVAKISFLLIYLFLN